MLHDVRLAFRTLPRVPGCVEESNFSFVEVADYRRESRTLDQFIEFGDWTFNVPIRAALGARGSLLRRQLLAENFVLAVLGGALGLGLAVSGLDLLIRYASRFTSRTGEIALDGWVLGFTLAMSLGMALLFAWAPRLTFLTDPVRAMAGAGGRVAGGPGRRRAQRALVVSQLAASFMLLIGAGLLMRSLYRLYAIDPGFSLSNVLSLQAPDFTQPNQQRRQQFSRDVLERVTANHAVQSAAVASSAPLAASFPQQHECRIDGADPDAIASAPKTVTRTVSSDYFKTIGPSKSDAPLRQRTLPRRLVSQSSASRWLGTTSKIRTRSGGISAGRV